jgi:hypothetical protein
LFGHSEFQMVNTPYHELHIRDGERIVAWIFVGPQDLPGVFIAIGREEHPEGGTTLYGDLLCGNPKDGGYLIDVEVTVGKGPDGPLMLGGGDRYDLSRGRCFVIRPGHEIEQLPYMNGAEAWEALSRVGGVLVAVYDSNKWWE